MRRCSTSRGRLLTFWLIPSKNWPGETSGIRVGRHRPGIDWWFDWLTQSDPSQSNMKFAFAMPGWSLTLATFAPTALLWYRDRRRQPSLCVKCGYDLRGTDHRVCPECGTTLDEDCT